ncbi:MAG TPA: IS3 family transposase, partial [Methanosarcina sp.]|nr:IS3 family transposase [Methanosarcina sp.]
TGKKDGSSVANEQVVDDIKTVLSGDFVCYGYHKVTVELRHMDYIINPKKVYRLMDENKLLLGKVIQTQGKRQWVKHRKITASKPLEYLCLDIKYVWVQGEHRFYYLLTVIDVYSRKILGWILQRSIKQMDVIRLLRKLDLEHSLKGVNVRNDNGSQFIAHKVRFFLRSSEANQEFTHIATPEENAYIEAYHSIFEKEVVQRFEFESYYEAILTITSYVDFYNNRRLHGGIGYKYPQKEWNEFYDTLSSDKQQPAQVSEDMSRVPASAGTRHALDMAGDTANFANRKMNETATNNQINHQLDANLFEKSVQVIGG